MRDIGVNHWLTGVVKEIQNAQRSIEAAQLRLRQAVQQARTEGHTWAEIGSALNMTRQAAFKRFGTVTDPATGATPSGVRMSIHQITQRTEQIFQLISTGSYERLEALIHPDVRSELSSSLIVETWARALTEVGAKESFTDTHVVLPAGARIEADEDLLGTVVGVTTINCEAGELMGRAAFDEQRRVVGLLLLPTGTTEVPF